MRIDKEEDIETPKVLLTSVMPHDIGNVEAFLMYLLPRVDFYLNCYDTNDMYHTTNVRVVMDFVYGEAESFVKITTGKTLLDHINYNVQNRFFGYEHNPSLDMLSQTCYTDEIL